MDVSEQFVALMQGGLGVVSVAWYILVVIAMWKVFTKAGYAGILAIIPIVNIIFLVKIAGYSGWLSLLYIVPIIGFIFNIMVCLRVGMKFGKSTAFSVFLIWIFSTIGFFIIGFGQAKYDRNAQ
ncbi:DUF5684 domain-containing protein [Leucobacter sp. CX42]|uniref:DUF5684 domain-containing protein n=1 Tax=unclassified Leucobacter TaxID=2621730 RepID=UPI003340A8FF